MSTLQHGEKLRGLKLPHAIYLHILDLPLHDKYIKKIVFWYERIKYT
jgi:hypothetical protein